jgi:RHH-type proline utilization regulon transcriptional repressor/proline dehydrogenase/delta 1-pyrroline-5-carboxylate dehydrogenase
MPTYNASKGRSRMALLSRLFGKSKPAPHTNGHRPAVAVATGDEAAIVALGADLLDRSAAHERGLLSAKFYSDKLINWAMKDPNFKTQLFRFVDAYPTLRTNEQVYQHVAEYLLRDDVKRPPGFDLGLKLGGFAKGAVAGTMGSQIRSMAKTFIAGATAEEAIRTLRAAWDRHIAFSVDLLGEVCLSDREADEYQRRYVEVLDQLAAATKDWPADEQLERDHLGPIPRINVSLKLSSLSARLNPLDIAASIADLRPRVSAIVDRAKQVGAFVHFDMEHSALRPLTIQAFKTFALEHPDLPTGLAMQAYLASGDDDAADLIAWSKQHRRPITVRLVKGAYWDYETINAEMQNWPAPVWPTKRQTDACFERMAAQFLESTPRAAGEGGVKLALGSHNLRSIAAALVKCDALGLPRSAMELQMLYGMADPMKAAAAELGLRVRDYAPLGDLVIGMAYLVRRLLENTSNESWLRAGLTDAADRAKLFASPHDADSRRKSSYDFGGAAARHKLSAAPTELEGRPFVNEPMRDFTIASEKDAFARAVASVQVPRVPIDATEADADRALATAAAACRAWDDAGVVHRANCLLRTASIMRQKRDEIAALVIAEAGKPWGEADADVCEAIDFCEFYARQAVGLFLPQRLGRFVGELDEVWHQPRGVAAVIAPWNFPLAIPCGMTVAALVCGNPTILKPAEQTPAIAKRLVEILHEAGVPRDVIQFVPGVGETVGAKLVSDPRTALIAFTGSKQVGLAIVREASNTPEHQAGVKKVIAEMGGKNAIIVDESADPDEAIVGVRQSAFGFAGQKCSACSRLIVVDSSDDGAAYRRFCERLVEATRCLNVGDPRDPGTHVGPVIDADAAAKIRGYVEIGKAEATLALETPVPSGLEQKTGRKFVGPTIFLDVPDAARIWREEIFGPVLAVTRATSFDAALALANASPYKLTGGVYTRTPSHLDRAKREFRVGNLYVNRGITGALVGRQPFGGFGHSGVGSKAGGSDYLLQFVEPRACCENTLRRGFAPES